MSDELFTAQEIAEAVKVKTRTVKGWARSGRIPSFRLSSKLVRFDKAAVLSALASGTATLSRTAKLAPATT